MPPSKANATLQPEAAGRHRPVAVQLRDRLRVGAVLQRIELTREVERGVTAERRHILPWRVRRTSAWLSIFGVTFGDRPRRARAWNCVTNDARPVKERCDSVEDGAVGLSVDENVRIA